MAAEINLHLFQSKQLPGEYYLAPDGSEIRLLLDVKGGGLAHCTLPAGNISIAHVHKTVDEIWYFVSGHGKVWRKQADREEIVDVEAGECLTVPVGTHFQFCNTGQDSLQFIIATIPRWPGKDEAKNEALKVQGYWNE